MSPDLTVLKAVSLAGGLRRTPEGAQRVERDFITAEGNHDVYVAERNRLYAKRARLLAEMEGKDRDRSAERIAGCQADGQKLIADETSIMQTRDQTHAAAADGDRGSEEAAAERDCLAGEEDRRRRTRQIELAREELKGIGNLADQGLVVNARVLTIEQQIADLEGKVLDIDTASLRAKQDISKAGQDATNLQNDRDAELAAQDASRPRPTSTG